MANEIGIYRLWIHWLWEAVKSGRTPTDEVSRDMDHGLALLRADQLIDQWLLTENYNNGLFFDANDPSIIPTVTDAVEPPVQDCQITLRINVKSSDADITSGVLAYVGVYRDDLEVQVQKKGRRPFEPHPAKYKLSSRPDVEALTTTLAAYRLIVANPKRPYSELADELMKEHNASPSWAKQSDGTDRRDALSNMMSKYRARANELMDGVVKGVFP